MHFRPTHRARRRCHCSGTPSAPTCGALRRGCRATRRWSTSRRAGAGPMPSSRRPSTASPRGCSSGGTEPGDRVGIWSPNCPEWVLAAVRHGQHRGDPRHRQPRVPDPRARVRAASGRHPPPRRGGGVQDGRLPGHDRRGAAALRRTGRRDHHRDGRVGGPLALSTPTGPASPRWRRGSSADDPINIQYTSGTTGFPKGATLSHHNILNNGFFVGELCGYTDVDRVCIPVPFYHCFGMTMGNLGCTTHGATMVIPSPGFDPAATLAAVAAGALHLAVRRADHVHCRARRAGLRLLRPDEPAHRDHGGLAVPGRGDEAGRRRAWG